MMTVGLVTKLVKQVPLALELFRSETMVWSHSNNFILLDSAQNNFLKLFSLLINLDSSLTSQFASAIAFALQLNRSVTS